MAEKAMRDLAVGDVFVHFGAPVKVTRVQSGWSDPYRNITVEHLYNRKDDPQLLINCGELAVSLLDPADVCPKPFRHGSFRHVWDDDGQCTMCGA